MSTQLTTARKCQVTPTPSGWPSSSNSLELFPITSSTLDKFLVQLRWSFLKMTKLVPRLLETGVQTPRGSFTAPNFPSAPLEWLLVSAKLLACFGAPDQQSSLQWSFKT